MSLNDPRTSIQAAMRAAFPEAEARVAPFYYMQEYHLGWRDTTLQTASFDPGKLLRPRLALLACATVGGAIDQALPLAGGIQLIHDFSLIHDDIEDNSDTRRGRTTVWTQWGLAQGINVGDGMFVVAHLALHRLAETGLSATLVLDVLRRFDQTILEICEGQYLDLSFEGRIDVAEADYLAMIARKTAALLAAATGLGALVGGASADAAERFFAFGHNLGLAFQIEDDILGIWGDPDVTGKPRAADILQRKLTLPVIYALRQADPDGELAQSYRQRAAPAQAGQAPAPPMDGASVARVLELLEAAGARSYSEEMATRYHQATVAELDRVPVASSPAAQAAHAELRAMVAKLSGRRS